MKRSILALAASAAVLAIAAQGSLPALFINHAAKLKGAQVLRARVLVDEVGGSRTVYDVTYGKSGLFRIESDARLVVSDGTTVTSLDKAKNTFSQSPADAAAMAKHTTETEVSLEMILFGRLGVDITQAWQHTTNQIARVNVPAWTGYAFQWVNGGLVEGQTSEVSLEAQLYQRPNFGWTSNLVFDHSTATMLEWPFPCLRPGHLIWCPGESMYAVYGSRFLDNLNSLAPEFATESPTYPEGSPHHNGSAWERRDEFQVNDEGWVVWVGKGNHYTEGKEKNLWGTTTKIAGIVYEWGIPNWWLNSAGAVRREQVGNHDTFNFGWGNNFRVGSQLTAGMQWMASVGSVGFDRSWSGLSDLASPKYDQGGKPDELKKPVRYNYAESGPGSHWHKSLTEFLKLQSLNVAYQLNSDQIGRLGLGALGMQAVTIGLTGRDLITIHNCSCINAEASRRIEDGEEGVRSVRNSTTARLYPASATLTGEISVTF
jgi:hypothetical protein